MLEVGDVRLMKPGVEVVASTALGHRVRVKDAALTVKKVQFFGVYPKGIVQVSIELLKFDGEKKKKYFLQLKEETVEDISVEV